MNAQKEFPHHWLFSTNTAATFAVLAVIGCAAALISGCASSGDSASACCCLPSKAQTADSAVPATGIVPAAPGSIEAQLMSQGNRWHQAEGPIVSGSYVEDILKDRRDQPQGRGWIGKVISVTDNAAMVDFGRGYSVGIFLSELRPVSLEKPS